MNTHKIIKTFACTLIAASSLHAQAFVDNFNTQAEFEQNWRVSTWGSTAHQYSADNVSIQDSALVLKLNASPQGTIPVGGEVTWKAQTFKYGSFSARIKTTNIPGSVIGFFVYKDGVPGDGNLHEVDIELLTNSPQKMYYTLHHDGYSTDHTTRNLPWLPSDAYHDYRMDWHPDSVVYYIDGERTAALYKSIPDDDCSLILNHWSKNIAGWGGPAPTEDTYMYIDQVSYTPLDEITPILVLKQNFKINQNSENTLNIEFDNSANRSFRVVNLLGKVVLTKQSNQSSVSFNLSKTSKQHLFLQVLENGKWTPGFEI